MSKFNLAMGYDVSIWNHHKHLFKVAKITGLGYGVADVKTMSVAWLQNISVDEVRTIVHNMNDVDDWCDNEPDGLYRFKVVE